MVLHGTKAYATLPCNGLYGCCRISVGLQKGGRSVNNFFLSGGTTVELLAAAWGSRWGEGHKLV